MRPKTFGSSSSHTHRGCPVFKHNFEQASSSEFGQIEADNGNLACKSRSVCTQHYSDVSCKQIKTLFLKGQGECLLFWTTTFRWAATPSAIGQLSEETVVAPSISVNTKVNVSLICKNPAENVPVFRGVTKWDNKIIIMKIVKSR